MQLKNILILLLTALAIDVTVEDKPEVRFILPAQGKGSTHNNTLCLRFSNLNNTLTDIYINADDPPLPTKQVLSVSVTDNFDNILMTRNNLPDALTKITFVPLLHSIVDICLVNEVKDASWSYKRVAREISLKVLERNAKSKLLPAHSVLKDKRIQLQSLANSLRRIVYKNLRSARALQQEVMLLEYEKRDLNEGSYVFLGSSMVVFAIASLVFQAGSVVILRRFDQNRNL